MITVLSLKRFFFFTNAYSLAFTMIDQSLRSFELDIHWSYTLMNLHFFLNVLVFMKPQNLVLYGAFDGVRGYILLYQGIGNSVRISKLY